MLFRRRNPPHWLERLRVYLWPRHSWTRSARYVSKRILRLSASPHAIAAGVAAGAFASFTPFLGLHFVISFVISFIVRGNMIAAALGTAVGNPLTFPFIWWSTYELGFILLNEGARPLRMREIARSLTNESFVNIVPLLKTMSLGAVPLGLLAAAVVYVLVRFAVQGFQIARRKRLSDRLRLTRARALAATVGRDKQAREG